MNQLRDVFVRKSEKWLSWSPYDRNVLLQPHYESAVTVEKVSM
jgi:hypothetical protein